MYPIWPQEPADYVEMDDKVAVGINKPLPPVPPSLSKVGMDRRQAESREGSVCHRACDSPYLESQYGLPPEEDEDEQGEHYTPHFSQHVDGSR